MKFIVNEDKQFNGNDMIPLMNQFHNLARKTGDSTACDFYNKFYTEWSRIRHKSGLNSKQFIKKIFGKQMLVVDYSNRNWVWSFTNEDKNATIYFLANVRGLYIEFDKGSRKDRLLGLLMEIFNYLKERC